MDQAVQAEGVSSEGTPAPVVESPPTEQGEQTAKSETDTGEVLPFDKHPRWQKIQKERREYQSRAQQLEQEMKANEGLFGFGKFLKANPQIAKAVYEKIEELSNGKGGNQKDPYAEYDPDVADRFRTLDELKQWKADQERQRQEQETYSTQEVQQELDGEFDQRLKKDGFFGEDGSPKNEKVVEVVSLAMKSFLDNTSRNPSRPSRAEFDAAYQNVMEVYNFLREEASKDALKNAVTTHVPATGTGKGAPPGGKTTRTERDRIADLVNSI